MITCETRRELGRCDQCRANPDELLLKIVCAHVKPAEDWINIAIFTENPPGIGRIWPMLRETRQGLDEYGHIHRKPAEDWTDMAIFTQNPPRIGRIWPYSPKTRRGWGEYGYIYRKPGGDRINMAISIENPTGME